MKNLISKHAKKIIIGLLLFFLPILLLLSQPGPPSPGGAPSGPPLPHNEKHAPIDGGLGVLLLMGGGYAIFNFMRRKKPEGES